MKICREPGCPQQTPCPHHTQTTTGWTPDHIRGNRHQRGYGNTWTNLRQHILKRDQHTCQHCQQPGNHVDHITPKHQGGTDNPRNLQTLCVTCHQHKTLTEAK